MTMSDGVKNSSVHRPGSWIRGREVHRRWQVGFLPWWRAQRYRPAIDFPTEQLLLRRFKSKRSFTQTADGNGVRYVEWRASSGWYS
jgi:hypothetical protein